MNQDDISKALQALHNEIIKNRNDASTQNQQLHQQNQQLLAETVSLSRKMDEYNVRFERLEMRVDMIETQQDETNRELDTVQQELNELQQKNLELNLLISGMPEINDEKQQQTEAIVTKLFTVIDFKAPSSAVRAVKRIGNGNKSNPRPILVIMDSVVHKDEVLAAKRAQKVTADQIFQKVDKPSPIYIDQHLTRQNGYLFKQARAHAKSSNTKYVWVKSGIIYMKHSNEGRAFAIRSESDIQAYLSSVPNRKRKNHSPHNQPKKKNANQNQQQLLQSPRYTRNRTAAAAAAVKAIASQEAVSGTNTGSLVSAADTPVLISDGEITTNGGNDNNKVSSNDDGTLGAVGDSSDEIDERLLDFKLAL